MIYQTPIPYSVADVDTLLETPRHLGTGIQTGKYSDVSGLAITEYE